MTDLRIEYMPLASLIAAMDSANPKDHDLGAIHVSMDKFGFVETPYLNETTGRIIAGHGRLEALQQKKRGGMKAPARIEVRADDWYVPVTRGIAFATDEEARAYLIASNRISEIGGWHEAELAALLQDLRSEDESLMQAAGYTDEDLERLLNDLSEPFIPEPSQQKEPVLPTDHMIEIYCSKSDLEFFRPIFSEWGKRSGVTINIS